MIETTFTELTINNFCINSLDNFIRHQETKECYRLVNGELLLVKNEFIREWNIEECREKARQVIIGIQKGYIAHGAFYKNEIIGFILVSNQLLGSQMQYAELKYFYVSEPYRNRGIGKKLFDSICERARELQIKKLYISAYSSKESQLAYRKLGCVDANEIIEEIANAIPLDIEMEYEL